MTSHIWINMSDDKYFWNDICEEVYVKKLGINFDHQKHILVMDVKIYKIIFISFMHYTWFGTLTVCYNIK